MQPAPHEQLVAAVRLAIARSGLQPGGDHPCSYLPGRMSREVAFRIEGLEPGLYAALMDLNFRRSGRFAYRPECDGCRECRAIRVPVGEFRPNRTQRRTSLQSNSYRPDSTSCTFRSWLGRFTPSVDCVNAWT